MNSHKVEHLIVGGYALAYPGSPRYTGDIDLFLRASEDNARRVAAAIRDFGFGSSGLTDRDFREPHRIVQLGHPPNRVDLITGLSGVTFEEAWEEREAADPGGVPVQFIGSRVNS